ncbi:MAG: hypothetical protein Q4E51_03250 [Lachnospiraceae bacterium]|nr:hypothetical protein [Lachnospiraceae bacterium]
MKVKNILKGIGKLVLATSLMCGIGLFLCQDVKAAKGEVTFATDSDGGITYTVVAPTATDTDTVTEIQISVGGNVFKTITSGIASGTYTKEDIIRDFNSTNKFIGSKAITIKYTLDTDGATHYNNTATGTASTLIVDNVKVAKVTGKAEAFDFEKEDMIFYKEGLDAYIYAGHKINVICDPVPGYIINEWNWNGNGNYLPDEGNKIKLTVDKSDTLTPSLVAKVGSILVRKPDGNDYELPTSIAVSATASTKKFALSVKDATPTHASMSKPFTVSPAGSYINDIQCTINGTDLEVIAKTTASTPTTFKISVPDGAGTFEQNITIEPAKGLTNATINGLTSGSGKGYLNTAFSVAGAVNPGASATYKWTVSGPGGSFGNDTLQSTSYTPTATGTHTITLTATDTLDGTTTKTATYVLTVDTRATKLTLDLQNPEVTVGYKNIVVAKATEGSLNGFSASDFKLTSTDTDKVSFDSTPTISADGSTLSFVIKGEKASTDAKISISGPRDVTLTVSNNTVKVYDLGTVEYNSSSRTLSVKMPDKVITGPNLKNNLKEVTGFKLKAYHGDEEIASLEKSGKNTSVTASELENIVTNNASKFTGETDSIWFKIIPYGTNTSGDKSEAKDKDDKVISKNTDGIAVYRVQVSGENIQTTTTYGLQGQQVKVTATPNPGCSFDKWSDGSTTPTKTVTVSSTTANNNLTAKGVLGERTPGANGGANSGDTSGLDRVPKTAESNAPIWLIIVLVFAAMGGGYALYLQMRPVKEDNKSNK